MIVYVLIASALVYSWKLLGYLIPERFITPQIRAYAERVTVTLLAALVAVQGFTGSSDWQLDARAPALLVAGVMLWLKVPFVLVIAAAALVAAGLRFLGF